MNIELSDAEVAVYDAPFPDGTFEEGARIFPSVVPTSTGDPAAADKLAVWEVLEQWDEPFVCCFSNDDPVTAGDEPFLRVVPGTQGQPHTTVTNARHFFQEDGAEQIAQILIHAIGPR
jgi:haloalkane dehalogenase